MLHYSLIAKRSVFELSLHAWAGAGLPAVLCLLLIRMRGVLGGLHWDLRKRDACLGLGGELQPRSPRPGPAPAAQKRPEKQIRPQLSASKRQWDRRVVCSELSTLPLAMGSGVAPQPQTEGPSPGSPISTGCGLGHIRPGARQASCTPEGLKVRRRKGKRGGILIYE